MDRQRLRKRSRKIYTDDDDDFLFEEVLNRGQRWQIEDKLENPQLFRGNFVNSLKSEDLNYFYIQKTGFSHPVIIENHHGLGLRVPTSRFTVDEVRQCVGSNRMIDVINVDTQESFPMSMKSWTEYYNQPAERRDRLLNVISLECSQTKLENYVESPSIVRQLDWISVAWPQYWIEYQTQDQKHIKNNHMYYPKTRKYVLMSVAKCFTDFHIDMGGSSVWYHLVKGKKIFWLLPPTESHLRLYEEWNLTRRQNECFFADLCQSEDCQMFTLEAGSTFFLPSGWIHAVYTVEDSLVFGGNFLHSFQIPMQIEVWNIERRVRVGHRFRYPYFIESLWYLLAKYVQCLTNRRSIVKDDNDEQLKNKDSIKHSDLQLPPLSLKNNSHSVEHQHLTQYELQGLRVLCTFLNKLKEKSIPEDLHNSDSLLETMERLLLEHQTDDGQLALTGQSLLHYHYHPDHPYSFDSGETNHHQASSGPVVAPLPPSATSTIDMQSHSSSNIVTLHPSTTVLLSGPLANPNYYPSSHYVNNYNPYPSPTPVVYPTDKAMTGKDRHKRVRCKQCEPCCRDDCSECVHCKDMPKFGGVGKMKQCCLTKQCIAPILPSTASCQVCTKKKGSRKLSQLKPEEILYECERCMEIHHLPCFHSAHADVSTNEGVFSDDIPETWLCPKCINANTPEPPLYKLRPIVRRTLVTTNKGKNGLIELPYNEPAQVYHPHHSHGYPSEYHSFYPTHPNQFYPDHYETMENEAKKRRLYPSNGYPIDGTNVNGIDPSISSSSSSSVVGMGGGGGIGNAVAGAPMNNHLVAIDDLSQSLNDSDLYVPQMFVV